ncbi:hypothetical protein JW916_00950 [Candidatus Sumerlaeota bacterium]|nr:hypothetical protein [Candidatus Sumerlaeota bacterium]
MGRVQLSFRILLAAWAMAVWLGSPVAWSLSPRVEEIRNDTEWFAGFENRLIGSPSHDAALRELEEKIRAVPGVQVWTHEFPVVAPVFGRAELTLEPGSPSAGTHRIYPIWPASCRPNTTPKEGISGRLVYIEEADIPDVPSRSLRGNIAVMEFVGRRNWERAANAGARAILLLGSPRENLVDAHSHIVNLPIDVPRFYIPEGPLADSLRTSQAGQGRLYAEAKWEEVTGRNIYALLKSEKAPEGQKVLAFGVPTDAMCVVPELAKGADVAVDTALALNLLRHYAENPPPRHLLFAFVDAYGMAQIGSREMLAALSATPREREIKIKGTLDRLGEYREHVALVRQLDETGDPLAQLHLAGGGASPNILTAILGFPVLIIAFLVSGGRKRWVVSGVLAGLMVVSFSLNTFVLKREMPPNYRPLHRYVKDEVARFVVQVEAELFPKRLDLAAVPKGEKELRAKLEKEVEALDAKRKSYFAAQKQMLTEDGLTPEVRPIAEDLWRRVRDRVLGQEEQTFQIERTNDLRNKLRGDLMDELGLNGLPDAAETTPLSFLMGLDLSDSGIVVGPNLLCDLWAQDEKGNFQSLKTWLLSRIKDERAGTEVWPENLRRYVDISPAGGQEYNGSYSMPHVTTLTSGIGQSFGVMSTTWATLDGYREKVDTAYDRPDRLRWDRLEGQIEATFVFLDTLLSDTEFPRERKVATKWSTAEGVVVDLSPGEPVPRVPMAGYLVTLQAGTTKGYTATPKLLTNDGAGVRRQEFRFTGVDGSFRFDVIPGHVYGNNHVDGTEKPKPNVYVQGYLLADDGRIIRGLDLAKAGRGIRVDIKDIRVKTDLKPLRAVAFTCEELDALEISDTRFFQDLGSATILDVRRGGPPQRVNFTLAEGIMTVLLEPGTRWMAVLRAGVARNRMALLNVMEPNAGMNLPVRETMKGFVLGEPLAATPFYQSALDLYRLDERRLRDYRAKGITSVAIDDLHANSARMLAAADEAIVRDDGAASYYNSTGALANEIRTYQATRDTAQDVVRGAIFLLLALVPFAYALERLLVATPRIYRQIVSVLIIFGVMTAILWSFHPAFKISTQPLMIIMAFGIIFMSLMVMTMVYMRFSTAADELRSGRAEASGAKTSRFGVASTAFRLGIANMRKRKLRTFLTGFTIVLVTFALLCFTSTSSYVGQRESKLDVVPPYTGVLVREPSLRKMPADAVDHIRSIVGPDRIVSPRYWWLSEEEGQWRLHVRNPKTGKAFSANAGLGLDAAESHFTDIAAICPEWERFAQGNGCYLSETAAKETGLEPGDEVVVGGRTLELIATYDTAEFDRGLKGIDGMSISPADYSMMYGDEAKQMRTTDLNQLAEELESGAGLESSIDLRPLSGSQVVVLPAKMVQELAVSDLRSVAIQASDTEDATSLASLLVSRVAFPIYYSSAEGTRAITTIPLLPRPPKSLFIPLLIAGLIIFNTMLSSIAERKREIHIYTSLGLAPLHVGFLFLAEAITYGLMGAIFGYVVGQGLATVFSHFGWMGGLTLNYSGTQTISVMIMVLAVVIVSSLVPAYLAGKLAAPSNKMTWHVPRPVDDAIRDTLPFTVTGQTANGVVAYLYEYLDAHREGSIGNFATDDLKAFHKPNGGVDILWIEGTVWLAPYDLGVRQQIQIGIRETVDEDIYAIDLELQRGSGQVQSWWKLNRVFIGDLRKQLLGWRKLQAESAMRYIGKGNEMLGYAEVKQT